jgi:hypothetical protein
MTNNELKAIEAEENRDFLIEELVAIALRLKNCPLDIGILRTRLKMAIPVNTRTVPMQGGMVGQWRLQLAKALHEATAGHGSPVPIIEQLLVDMLPFDSSSLPTPMHGECAKCFELELKIQALTKANIEKDVQYAEHKAMMLAATSGLLEQNTEFLTQGLEYSTLSSLPQPVAMGESNDR